MGLDRCFQLAWHDRNPDGKVTVEIGLAPMGATFSVNYGLRHFSLFSSFLFKLPDLPLFYSSSEELIHVVRGRATSFQEWQLDIGLREKPIPELQTQEQKLRAMSHYARLMKLTPFPLAVPHYAPRSINFGVKPGYRVFCCRCRQ